ncbi:MAG: FtsX-like permease family protein [Fuerstiella sp.]|nr:FtsX-like permease family protein [Fuerstiella sp.]
MYKILLCLRYLRTRYIALASIISVMLGVATMIVVNSVMAGFTNEMRDRIHGFLADVVVESRSMSGIVDSTRQMAIVQDAAGEFIAAMTPTVEVPAMITYSDPVSGERFTQSIQLVGIDPGGKAQVGPLKTYLDSYNAVTDEGEVLRPSLRPADTAPGWELTDHAKKYRKMMKQQQMLFLREEVPLDGLPVPAPEFDGQQAPAADADSDVAPPEFNVASEQALATDDPPIAPPDFNTPLQSSTQARAAADPAAPLNARVFLGEQITSFQTRDPDTGKLHKVNMVNPGDDILITTIQSDTPPEPISFSATVVDMFRSGMSEYDGQLVLMNLEQLQKNRGMILNGEDAITSIQIKLHDYEDSDEVVKRLRAAFPPGAVTVSTWEAKQGLLLSAVEVETAILNVLLFMIIAVAGFGILAIFFMIVVEKTRDIGILKSLGASSKGVMSIFLSYGLGLGVVGSAAGVAIGLLFVHYINEIEDGLSWVTGRKVFDEKIYYFFEIPTQVNPLMVMWVAVGAIAIAVLASVLPARRASRLHPVRALRYE